MYVVERYATGLTPASLRATGLRMACPGRVAYLGSVLVPSDEGSLCLFSAESRAAVEEAAEREGTPFERVVEAELVGLEAGGLSR